MTGLAARRVPPAEAPAAAAARPGGERFAVLRSTRLRILTSYIVLLAFSAVLLSFATREVLIIRLNDDVDLALDQEVRELDRLLTDGVDPRTGEPFTSLRALFDVYLARNVPGNEEGMVTFVDGRIHATELARFPLEHLPTDVLASWAAFSTGPGADRRVSGRFATALGDAHFAAARLHIGDSPGAFVVTILPAGALGAIGDLQTYSVLIALLVLLLATALAWLVAGRVLAPVRLLTETAQSISQSDLTQRIEVHGSGEPAEMARSFNGMLDRLEALFRDQREFVQDAGHELRDPLTICRGHLELLGDEPEERRATVALVMDELDRMARIVDDLQLLADAQQPDFIRPEPIDLPSFIRELAAKASALESRRWEVDGAADGVVVADRYRLTEAVMNLAHNAVQHTQADETVAIGASLDGDEVHMWVRDSGVGIPASEQARVFGRFVRGTGAHRRYRGAGLGLAIVAAVAEAHGGRVELDSRPGQGSTFTIIIPTRATTGGVPRGYDPDR